MDCLPSNAILPRRLAYLRVIQLILSTPLSVQHVHLPQNCKQVLAVGPVPCSPE